MSRKQHWVEVMQRAKAERNGPASEHLLVHPDQARLLPDPERYTLFGGDDMSEVVSIEGDGPWRVLSSSGQEYTVDSKTKLDERGSMYFTWHCTCSARKRCHHIDAVEEMRRSVEAEQATETGDYDGLNLLDRYE